MTPDDDSELSVIETEPPDHRIRIESPGVGSVVIEVEATISGPSRSRFLHSVARVLDHIADTL
jgi:hypothetical protein